MPVYSIKIEGLSRLSKALRQSPQTVITELSNAVKTSVNIIRPIMVSEAPIKSSRLRENIYASSNGLHGEVGPDLRATKYAYWVHEGTKPYTIKPKTKKALYWKGAMHPIKIVHHPGIKPNRYVERTRNKINAPIRKIFENAITKIVKRLGE